ncbi:uncharacterized protein DC041_0008133 [Schistosoma bovis]|uniref:Peptidase A2 domain-containing protein n=1 Tax=Schistosoma bovis TaxID=6184 RepID=A0A430QCE1_SCHBO|nr:uncharacterized protein DC041_0008133 [Schistosoma bovis]
MVATNVSDHAPTCLFHVLDKTSRYKFLVDTGAEVSVIPLTLANKPIAKSGKYTVRAANKTKIKTFGEQSLTLDLGIRRHLTWVFIIANVRHPILGADFLSFYNLMVDVKRRKLVDSCTKLQVKGTQSDHHIHSIKVDNQVNDIFASILPTLPKMTKTDYSENSTQRSAVHRKITIKKKEIVSTDRIKPAFIESGTQDSRKPSKDSGNHTTQFPVFPNNSSPTPTKSILRRTDGSKVTDPTNLAPSSATLPSTETTRSGRHVHFPKRYVEFIT